MSFEWKLEDLKLVTECKSAEYSNAIFHKRPYIFQCENEVSREDKIAFVDAMQDGKLSYILELSDKFLKDVENLPKDAWGDVKTVSLKAWIRRNDTRNLIDVTYTYGLIRCLGGRNIVCINRKGAYDAHEDYVDNVFHNQLKLCRQKEHEYFLSHDEYSILKQKLRDYDRKYPSVTFGIYLGFHSSGEIVIYADAEYKDKRAITMDELKLLISKYEQLDAFVETLNSQVSINY